MIQPNQLPSSLSLLRRVEISQASFEQPVTCPFGDHISLADKQAVDWLQGPQGQTMGAQDLCKRVDTHQAETGQAVRVTEEPNGDGFIGPDRRAHVAMDRVQEGVQRDSAETVYFRQFSQGYDGQFEARFRTEVHCSDGKVVILQYGPRERE